MSTVVTEALREKLGRPRDGFLNIVSFQLGTFAVMFSPLDAAEAVRPHSCSSLDTLKVFLGKLGVTDHAVRGIVKELGEKKSSSVRLSLTEEKIALINDEITVLRRRTSADKFMMFVPEAEADGLGPNYGELTEEEVRMLLATNYKKTPSEIGALLKQAKAYPGI